MAFPSGVATKNRAGAPTQVRDCEWVRCQESPRSRQAIELGNADSPHPHRGRLLVGHHSKQSEADGALSNNHGRHQSLIPMIWFIRARAPDRQA
jgi:hypothetical protein